MPPTTGFEDSSGASWTTLSEETTFLQTIASETDAVYQEAGESHDGNPIHRLDVGDGPHTLLCVALQHGDEPAGREMALQQARDLAYTTDPVLLTYLAGHRVVFLTPGNPDRFLVSRNLGGAQGNLNRHHHSLESIEAKIIAEVIAAVDPQIVYDAHEKLGAGYDTFQVEFKPPTSVMVSPRIKAASEDLFDVLMDAADAAGYSSRRYPTPTRRMLSEVVGLRNMVGMLAETYVEDPDTQRRVDAHMAAFDAAVGWHDGPALADDIERGRIEAAGRGRRRETFRVETGMNFTDPQSDLDLPAAYRLDDPADLDLWSELWGVQVAGGGIVGLDQPLASIIPAILDEAADDVVASATRVERGVPVRVPRDDRWVATIEQTA